MSKLTILGAGFFLLLCAGIYAAMRFPIGCLFVPCDRSLRFVIQPLGQDLDGCKLALFDPDDKKLAQPYLHLAITEGEAGMTIQPSWNESVLVALSCPGLRLSDPELVDYEDKSSVEVHIRKPGA